MFVKCLFARFFKFSPTDICPCRPLTGGRGGDTSGALLGVLVLVEARVHCPPRTGPLGDGQEFATPHTCAYIERLVPFFNIPHGLQMLCDYIVCFPFAPPCSIQCHMRFWFHAVAHPGGSERLRRPHDGCICNTCVEVGRKRLSGALGRSARSGGEFARAQQKRTRLENQPDADNLPWATKMYPSGANTCGPDANTMPLEGTSSQPSQATTSAPEAPDYKHIYGQLFFRSPDVLPEKMLGGEGVCLSVPSWGGSPAVKKMQCRGSREWWPKDALENHKRFQGSGASSQVCWIQGMKNEQNIFT